MNARSVSVVSVRGNLFRIVRLLGCMGCAQRSVVCRRAVGGARACGRGQKMVEEKVPTMRSLPKRQPPRPPVANRPCCRHRGRAQCVFVSRGSASPAAGPLPRLEPDRRRCVLGLNILVLHGIFNLTCLKLSSVFVFGPRLFGPERAPMRLILPPSIISPCSP